MDTCAGRVASSRVALQQGLGYLTGPLLGAASQQLLAPSQSRRQAAADDEQGTAPAIPASTVHRPEGKCGKMLDRGI